MRKILLAGVLLGVAIVGTPALAATITVQPGQSIQESINRASPGDTIYVAPGEYQPFTINRNNISVVSAEPGRARIVASSDRAISSYGQSNVSIVGFRVYAPNSDGIAAGGNWERQVSSVRIEGIIVENAGKDAIKVFHVQNSQIIGNRIEYGGSLGRVGSSGNSNGDGGIDCVRCDNTLIQGNNVTTQGWAALMLKGGSNHNRIKSNNFTNTDPKGTGMAVGGTKGPRTRGIPEASNNIIENNTFNTAGCALHIFASSENNRIDSNQMVQGRSNCMTSRGSNNPTANVSGVPTPVGGKSKDMPAPTGSRGSSISDGVPSDRAPAAEERRG